MTVFFASCRLFRKGAEGRIREELLKQDLLEAVNIPLYVEMIIEDNLPSVEEALADLKTTWKDSLEAGEKFKTIIQNYIQMHIKVSL